MNVFSKTGSAIIIKHITCNFRWITLAVELIYPCTADHFVSMIRPVPVPFHEWVSSQDIFGNPSSLSSRVTDSWTWGVVLKVFYVDLGKQKVTHPRYYHTSPVAEVVAPRVTDLVMHLLKLFVQHILPMAGVSLRPASSVMFKNIYT